MSGPLFDLSAGNCVGVGNSDIFIEVEFQNEARRACVGCPVADECLITGVLEGYEGVWGGIWLNRVLSHTLRAHRSRRAFRKRQSSIAGRLGMTLNQYFSAYGEGVKGLEKAAPALKQATVVRQQQMRRSG